MSGRLLTAGSADPRDSTTMATVLVMEWLRLTPSLLADDPAIAEAVDRFEPPTPQEAGEAAAEWLRRHALHNAHAVATWLMLDDAGEIAAFHALSMAEVVLTGRWRERLDVSHPRQGAVLIAWIARAAHGEVHANEILGHAGGIAQRAARLVGAAALAVDPFDEDTEAMWVEGFGFRRSATELPGRSGLRRLWNPLLPAT